MRSILAALVCFVPVCAHLHAQKSVPTAPPQSGSARAFRDAQFGVRFRIPPGWTLVRRDGEVSTFHLDARTASHRAEVRGVAAIDFNPYPTTTLSGAMFYFSVQPHATDGECARQALLPGKERDFQDIGGMSFTHAHDEHGGICVEARDEVYTAYRKGACYRFDLEVNTFCSASSGAEELSERQLDDIESRMTGILSTVVLDWSKTGANAVPLPGVTVSEHRAPATPAPSPRVLLQPTFLRSALPHDSLRSAAGASL